MQENTKYHFTEQQLYEELIRMGMQKAMAMHLANKYFHSDIIYNNLQNLGENFKVLLNAMEIRIGGIENFKTEIKGEINKLDTKIDNVKKELKEDINKLDTKIDNVKAELKEDINKLDTKID
ncbi:Bdr family repetitive protein, partial [Borrelia sp. A-FGy1]|uniref:Bdr family repetitive protein n=1 Tax=Borrelia sp. A-FGy1 TaxID=2608247 RepID=UPI001E5B09C5